VRLRVVDELPYPDVAARLGISEQAARARVSRALRALAGALDDLRPEPAT
jgi:RNA polymerase sigma-70 factor (ECF subfamily)